MTIIGNMLLFIASLIYVALVTSLSKNPPTGGDAGVGNVWGIIIMNGAFLICMLLSAIIIGIKGSFDWVSSNAVTRFFLVTVGILAPVITTTLSSLFKYEQGAPILKFFSRFVPVLVPLVLLIAGIILLNANIRNAVQVAVYKWPLVAVFIIGIIGIAAGLQDLIANDLRNQQAVAEGIAEDEIKNHDYKLQTISTCDVMKDMVSILVFTDDNQDKDVRDSAVAKVKSHPHWQQELIDILKSDHVKDAFIFLASNDADEPQLLATALNEGLLISARLIREDIRRCSHPSHLRADMFSWDVERLLRTVEKFNNNGTDYRPAMKEIRAALEEPSEFKKPTFDCAGRLDNWIKTHP